MWFTTCVLLSTIHFSSKYTSQCLPISIQNVSLHLKKVHETAAVINNQFQRKFSAIVKSDQPANPEVELLLGKIFVTHIKDGFDRIFVTDVNGTVLSLIPTS